MRKVNLLLFIGLFIFQAINAQPKTKTPAQPSVADMMKMAQEELNKMSPDAKRMMDSMGLNPNGIKVPAQPAKQSVSGRPSTTRALPMISDAGASRKVIPRIQTGAQLQGYLQSLLAGCKKNIDKDIIAGVDKALAGSGNPSMLPMLLLSQEQPTAAMYAGIKIAIQKPADALLMNNCGFLLHQDGYPENAVPIFNFLLQQNKEPIVYNNLGQAYLEMGLKAEARKAFDSGLLLDTASAGMHAGMAMILMQEGKKAEAIVQIRKSLKQSYSEDLEDLAEDAGEKMTYDDLKVQVPEYFNQNKYKPSESISVYDKWESLMVAREAQDQRRDAAKANASELGANMAAGLDPTESMSSLKDLRGNYGATALTARALHMRQLILDEWATVVSAQSVSLQARTDEAYKEFEKQFDYLQKASFDDRFARCNAQLENLNTYLGKTKQAADAYVRAVLPKLYEWCDGLIYWEAFLSRRKAYEAYVATYKAAFFEQIAAMSSLQVLNPRPSWVYNDCRNNASEKEKYKLELLEGTPDCPVSITAKLADVWAFKFTCDGIEGEVGEVLKLGWEFDAKKKEFTFLMGYGIGIGAGPFGAGIKGQAFLKFGKKGPVDMGLKGEAGAEMNLGPVNFEEKITAIMGMSSVNVEGTHAGNKVNIFNVDATK